MPDLAYRVVIATVAIAFTGFFLVVPVPPALESGDIVGAFAGGFVNPYASAYALDAIGCWAVLAAWVAHEARTSGVRGGWACLLLGLVPGVVVGFAAYLVVRARQLEPASSD